MNKKKLIFIANDKYVLDTIMCDLKGFFLDSLIIEGYNYKNLNKNHKIKGDVLLTLTPIKIGKIKEYFNEDIEIIQGTRTILKEKYNELKAYKKGTEAGVLNISQRTAFGLANFLMELGINNLNLKPYYKICEDINENEIVIVANELEFKLDLINTKIVNLRDRRITIETYKTIISMMNLKINNFEDKLKLYEKKLAAIEYSVIPITTIYRIEKILKTTINEIDYGIIIINNDNKIIYFNDSFKKMLKTNKSFECYSYLEREMLPGEAYEKINEKKNFNYDLLKVKEIDRNFLISKKNIKLDKSNIGSIIILKDTTEIEKLEMHLRDITFKKGHFAKYNFDNIKGESPKILEAIIKAKKMSKFDKTILIIGESGTGKEMFAQSIHNFSTRKDSPFVAINCATLSTELLESELFGYEEGAFTGAKKGGKKGLFEIAHKGTIFLDEIGDVSKEVQVKLLRVLEEKEIRKIGSDYVIPIDVRIIAATNKNLEKSIRSNKFRKDLFYRISSFTLKIPSLNERIQDVPVIIKDTLHNIGFDSVNIDKELLKKLMTINWGGNVRELINCVEYMVYMSGDLSTINYLPDKYKENNFKKNDIYELSIFTEKEKEILKHILYILKKRNMGRRKIHEVLQNNNIEISKYGLRIILEYLKEENHVEYGKGSKGASITEKGIRLLNIL